MPPVAIADQREIDSRRRTALHLASLTVIALVLTWPILMHGIPDLSHDGIMHATWTKPFAEQFWSGELYPRWLSNTNGGLGSAPFFVYPTLSTTVSALIAPLIGNYDPHGWLLAGISCVIAMILSGYTAYFWLRDLTDQHSALFAATLYLVMPYHTAIDLYNRGAELELWSFVAVPLVLLSVQAILRGSRWGFVALTASYALLILSHLPITVAFSLVPILLAFFMSDSGRWRAAFITVGALACGAGLAAIYMLPALFDQKKVHLEHHLDPYFSYVNWWLFSRAPLFDFKTRILVLTTLTLFFAAAMWSSARHVLSASRRKQAAFYGSVALMSYLMMTQLTYPIWKYVRPLQYLPFPSRFNVVLAAGTAALAAIAYPILRQASRVILVVCGLIVLVWLGSDSWAAATGYSEWRRVPELRVQKLDRSIELLRDYPLTWPATVNLRHYQFPDFENFLAQHSPKKVWLADSTDQPVGSVLVTNWRPREVHLQVQAQRDGILHINHFYYPGWQAYVEGSGQELPVQHDADGLLQIQAPVGAYSVTLVLEKDPAEKFGIAISSCFLLLLVAIGLLSAAGRTPGFLTCKAVPGDVPTATRPEVDD